jgi:phospholipase C
VVEAKMSRRQLLSGALAGAAGVAFGGTALAARGTRADTRFAQVASPVTTPTRRAGSLPFPHLRPGTDTLPQVENIVVLMLENHSFDNLLGMLGRGDGFDLGKDDLPTATNPDGKGKLVQAFHMPTPCQLPHRPSQTWNASHRQYDGGKMDGFVESASGPVAMGYWTGRDLPFTYGLARSFPVADRYFCSVLAQSYPNRRFLTSGTAYGIVDDTVNGAVPPNGTIFTTLNKYGISWRNYYSTLPTSYLYPSLIERTDFHHSVVTVEHFFADAAAGTLPGFSLIDPNFDSNSEENPQDIQFGEVFLARVVTALMSGPRWSKTLFVWTYDEHGGYYDHVPPPQAVLPDDVPPAITVPPDLPGSYNRYGFRVPAGVVSPNAKANYVSHVVHDHTSILKLIETKWNLPALTRRDANASDLLDMVDFSAKPRFSEPPKMPAPADPALRASCQTSGPGAIPPPGAVAAV